MLVSDGEKLLTDKAEIILELENWEHGDNRECKFGNGQERGGKGKEQIDALKQILQRQKKQ